MSNGYLSLILETFFYWNRPKMLQDTLEQTTKTGPGRAGPSELGNPPSQPPTCNGPGGNLVPKNFGSPKIWCQRSLGPARKSHVMIFMQGPNFLGPIFLGAQGSWGPNFWGNKNFRGLNEIGDHFSYSQTFSLNRP